MRKLGGSITIERAFLSSFQAATSRFLKRLDVFEKEISRSGFQAKSKAASRSVDRRSPRAARPSLSEQVCLQKNGFALIMLWHESAEEDEEESEDMTTRDRWRAQQERYRRD